MLSEWIDHTPDRRGVILLVCSRHSAWSVSPVQPGRIQHPDSRLTNQRISGVDLLLDGRGLEGDARTISREPERITACQVSGLTRVDQEDRSYSTLSRAVELAGPERR